jgi:hypothetical protein
MLSDHWAGELLEETVGSPAFLAMCTVRPVPADTGSTITEVAYGGYRRVELPAGTFGPPEGSGVVNIVKVALAPMTGPPGGRVIAWAICSALTGGFVKTSGDTVEFMIDLEDPEPSIGIGLLRVAFG